MSGRLEFFYDYVSSYSYLANSQVTSLGAAEIVYRPVFLGAIMSATGNAPPGNVPARAAYLQRDLRRWASRYNVPIEMNPVFPQNTLAALRLALVAMHEGHFQPLHQLLFDAMWAHGRNLGDPATLAEIANEAGLDVDHCLALSSSAEIKEQLKTNTDEAISRGAFGAPSFFVGNEMYFGNDRLDFVREALAKA